jgi:hypothetical protein
VCLAISKASFAGSGLTVHHSQLESTKKLLLTDSQKENMAAIVANGPSEISQMLTISGQSFLLCTEPVASVQPLTGLQRFIPATAVSWQTNQSGRAELEKLETYSSAHGDIWNEAFLECKSTAPSTLSPWS